MRYETFTWMNLEKYLKGDNRLILITGACEQHGHLSLLTDSLIPVAIADAASSQTGVLVAPPLHFGISTSFAAYPGTITLTTSTYLSVIQDVVESVYHQGFRNILVLNGHAGNNPARALLFELANRFEGLRTAWHSWWEAPKVAAVVERHGLTAYHASWSEAFSFTRVGPLPDGEKAPVGLNFITDAVETRRLLGDGVFGGPYKVPDDVMDELFEVAVQEVVDVLEKFRPDRGQDAAAQP